LLFHHALRDALITVWEIRIVPHVTQSDSSVQLLQQLKDQKVMLISEY
jgi:hypothetical protein